jgi:hypothetical protein
MPNIPSSPTTRALHDLHEDYIWLVNSALSRGREDLARELGERYTTEALELLTREA